MSYIKSAFIIDGIARIVEVHGATWLYMDVEGYARNLSQRYRRMASELSADNEPLRESYLKSAQEYARYADDPSTTNSGLAREVWERGLSPISNSNKRDWTRFLLEEDVPGNADNTDERPAVLADFDLNRFYDTEENFYARYEDTLPEGWRYERVTPKQMSTVVKPRLDSRDTARLPDP